MKEFYIKKEIPVGWGEIVRDEIVKDMRNELPNNASIRYEGYVSMGSSDFVIIYTTGE